MFMEIKHSTSQARPLFSKEIGHIEIRGVSEVDAKALTRALHNIYGVHVGVSAIVEILIAGKATAADGTRTQNISTTDRWETQEDCNHFVKGYELAMLLNGVDIYKDHLEWV